MGSGNERLNKKEQHDVLLCVHSALMRLPVLAEGTETQRNLINLIAVVANSIGKEREDAESTG